MSSRPKVLVTSVVGKTGMPTALQLLDHRYPVRGPCRQRAHQPRETVADRTPGSFESIVRNRLREHSKLAPSLPRKLLAMLDFLMITLTRKPDTRAIEARRDDVQLSAPRYCGDDPYWRATHHPKPTLKATGKAAK